MSDETIHLPATPAERGLARAAWALFRRIFARPARNRRMHVDALTERDRADLGLRDHDAWRADPRAPKPFGQHLF